MKIFVDTQEQKDRLLAESEYIHYLSEIDSDKASTLMHIYMNPDMIIVKTPNILKGFLEKKEEGWFVKWSDLHSFGHGTHWMWTPLHPNFVVDENEFKDGEKVEYEFINAGYDKDSFLPINYVEIKKL